MYLPYSRIDSSTWIASSRVGVRISARTGWRAGDGLVFANGASFCRIGRPKPAVLPVPVWAPPMTSSPCEDDGDRLGLDRGGGGVTGLGHGPENLRPQAELGKARDTRSSHLLESGPLARREFRSRQRNQPCVVCDRKQRLEDYTRFRGRSGSRAAAGPSRFAATVAWRTVREEVDGCRPRDRAGRGAGACRAFAEVPGAGLPRDRTDRWRRTRGIRRGAGPP